MGVFNSMFLMIVDSNRDPSGYQESLPDQLKRIRFAKQEWFDIVMVLVGGFVSFVFRRFLNCDKFSTGSFLTYSRIQYYLFT